jgi:hypothetical protein
MEILEVVFFYKTEKYTDPLVVFCGDYPDSLLIESLRCDFGRMSLIDTFKRILEAKNNKASSASRTYKNQECCSM